MSDDPTCTNCGHYLSRHFYGEAPCSGWDSDASPCGCEKFSTYGEFVHPNRRSIQFQVREFHAAMGITTAERLTIISDDRARLRLRLIAEEFIEVMRAALERPWSDFSGVTTSLDVAETHLRLAIEQTNIDINLPSFVDSLADLDY